MEIHPNLLIIITKVLVFFTSISPEAKGNFDHFFTEHRLRFDYTITGHYDESKIYPVAFHKEPCWGGSKENVIDTFRYGDLMLEVYDSLTGKLIYSRGYSSLFKEWQHISGPETMERGFTESVAMPFPRRTVSIKISERNIIQSFNKIFSCYLNPLLTDILPGEQPENTEVREIAVNGPSELKLDMVFVAEGYTRKEKDKFFADAKKYGNLLFASEPYKFLRDRFNLYAVFIPSDESGADYPPDSFWVNTALNTSFNTFGIERYLTVSDIRTLRNSIAGIPCEQAVILVNSDRYGGGAIFNSFMVFCTGHKYSEFLFHHELGHSLSSLADEYYTSEVLYEQRLDFETEPFQPNITTLVNFKSKWESMIPDTIPVPTPNDVAFSGVVGVFEGAAYQSKGLYRPMYDCRMKSISHKEFCDVCKKTIADFIRFYGPDK